ncbi:hypothetical protein Hanom_Chr05g00417201 [Helianthus anomalus]
MGIYSQRWRDKHHCFFEFSPSFSNSLKNFQIFKEFFRSSRDFPKISLNRYQDQGLFEQVTRGQQFLVEWDARYPSQGQTTADAPPGYITLYADFFGEGNFRLPVTHYMATILHSYVFHISQQSPMGMVRIRHFEFVCRLQGLEPTVEKFRVFYQLISTLGFFSFALRSVKKILINPPKRFHDWKMKFFFSREEVIPIAIEFRQSGPVPKEDTQIPCKAAWYNKLMANSNRVFGEQVLVAARMSNKWSEQSKDVPVLLFNGEEAAFYQSVFPTFSRAMGVRALREGEEYWYEQIKPNFIYARAELFANPHVSTEGAHIRNPRPCRSMTPAGKEIGSEESVASSDHELRSWDDVFAGVLRDLGIGHEEKKPKKAATKKKVNVAGGATSKKVRATRAAVRRLLKLQGLTNPLLSALSRKRTLRILPRSIPAPFTKKRSKLPLQGGGLLAVKDVTGGGGGTGGSGANARKGDPGKKPRRSSPIRAEDTLGDIYYKTYDESRANEPHAHVWNLKQNDTFVEFGACREWYLGDFPPAEASEDTLAKERREWGVACDNENKKMFATRTKIINHEAQVEGLKKSEADFKERYEEAKSHRERVEVDLNAKILSKGRDLAGKEAKIAELKRRLRKA